MNKPSVIESSASMTSSAVSELSRQSSESHSRGPIHWQAFESLVRKHQPAFYESSNPFTTTTGRGNVCANVEQTQFSKGTSMTTILKPSQRPRSWCRRKSYLAMATEASWRFMCGCVLTMGLVAQVRAQIYDFDPDADLLGKSQTEHVGDCMN